MIEYPKLAASLKERGYIKYQPDDPFVLASGQVSPWYFDIKGAMLSPFGRKIFGCLMELLGQKHSWKDVVGSTLVGIASAGYLTVMGLQTFLDMEMHGAVMRKNKKGYGIKTQWVGYEPKDEGVIIVEDVITTGGSLVPLLRTLDDNECTVLDVLCVVDRIETPHPDFKLEPRSLFKMNDLLELFE